MKRLPLALSSINNTLSTSLAKHDRRHETNRQLSAQQEVHQGKKRPLPQQDLPATTLSDQEQQFHAHAAEAASRHVPHGRKMLGSPRTARMVVSKAQEVAKKVPRSWEHPQSPERPRTPQPGRVHRTVMRISRSEACSPRVSNSAELWNEDLTPRQMNIRQKVTC